MNFKGIKQDSLSMTFKEFKPDVELRSMFKQQVSVECKPSIPSKSRTPKYVRDAYQKKDIEAAGVENTKSFTKAAQDSPKMAVVVGGNQGVDGVNSCKMPAKMACSQVGVNQEPNRSLTTRDKNKYQHELSRDKSMRKDLKSSGYAAKDRRKENMPPKQGVQNTGQTTSSQVNNPAQKPAKKYGKKIEDNRAKTSLCRKETGFAELGKISLTSSISKEVEQDQLSDRSAVSMSTQGLKLNSNKEENTGQPILIKRITDLDRARAMKKAASKNTTTTADDKICTPLKGDALKDDISHKSWSKSINKKVFVERDSSMTSENHSLRLTDIKSHLVPESKPPGFILVGIKRVKPRWLRIRSRDRAPNSEL